MHKYLAYTFVATAMIAQFAFAQNPTFQRVEPKATTPVNTGVQPQATQPMIANTPEMEIAALRKKIVILQEQNRVATEQNRQLTDRNNQLTRQIGEMTRKGGSQVKAYCEGLVVSRNTAGASRNCASSGYTCEPVSGLCYDQCATAEQCASGFACAGRRCVRTGG